MRKQLALFAAIAAVFAFMTFSAQAMPAAPLKDTAKSTDQVIQVRDGCGPHRAAARTATAVGTAAGATRPAETCSTRPWPGSPGPKFFGVDARASIWHPQRPFAGLRISENAQEK